MCIRDRSKRVGSDKLANVQSGGSWFHYYRDDTEGAYIGQVAPNGQLRMWKANGDNPGAEQNVVYGTGGQTAITNYLTTSDAENLQFLTINDTTFVTNRDSSNANTLVGQTGATADRPEAHCAMVELMRTENGRQYGLNIFDSTADSSYFNTIKRATKLNIKPNTIIEFMGDFGFLINGSLLAQGNSQDSIYFTSGLDLNGNLA